MATIHIEAEDWMMTAGLIGLVRLFPEDKKMITKTGAYITTEHLDELPTRYFNYLLTMFSVVERDVKRMSWYTNQLSRYPEKANQYAVDVRKTMNDQLKKVEKYFPDTEECHELRKVVESLKLVKKEEDAPKVEDAVKVYEQIMSTEFINEKLTLNYVKAIILGPFYGQPSFLQPTFNSKTKGEHEGKLCEDFTLPAKLELEFHGQLQEKIDFQHILRYLEEKQSYKPFKDWFKALKKKNESEEISNFFSEELFPCSFIEGLMATQSFEEMIFSPLALSKDKAVNFNWDFNKKTPVPISALARLLFFLVPIGLTFYMRRVGSQTASETLRFAGIVLSQQPFSETVKQNETYLVLRQKNGNSFGEAVATLLDDTTDKAKKKKNSYLFVEVYSSYAAKKTLLDYYHMPTYLTAYLSQYGQAIKTMYHREFRDEFLRTALKGQDPKRILFDYLRLAVTEPFHADGAYHATRERRRIIEARKGVKDVAKQDGKIHFIYKRGAELRQTMTKARSGGEEGPYRASGRKKIEGIAYRLLNAVKAGNKNAFMDTLFRVYMAADLAIPSVFTESYKEEGLDFETIASAFIAGLLGGEQKEKNGEAVTNG